MENPPYLIFHEVVQGYSILEAPGATIILPAHAEGHSISVVA